MLIHRLYSFSLIMGFLLIQACASSGNPKVADFNPSTQVEYGKTTKQEIQTMLGEPNARRYGADGKEVWVYSYAQAQARPATFIPVVGLFAGGMDGSAKKLIFAFDEKGILQKQGSGEGQSEIKTRRQMKKMMTED